MTGRRQFLAATGIALSTAVLARLEAFASTIPAPTPLSGAGIDADGWRTLGFVQDHLFPSETNAPGAHDVNALVYLHFVMNWTGTDAVEPQILRSGLAKLQDIAADFGATVFEALDEPNRDKVLRKLETGQGGTEWILLVLDYVFEALLADPVYGGNPGEIGWRWLAIEPGHRRPGPNQRYFAL